ncbi:Telomerase reverse transcriptase [Psilocybe cubensis]|uniref:Telomerase reverse transcriptase n=1 Tax=Psilocybe cubensis TaxID=181762 RepID=A0ACB8H0R4_PSICU|nr:Telomerase reverse transcriptase [Psilocybe cubensis]KAH9481585.1 Telomerase reverse transcriptase [Psilocybe cubensis]
MSTSDDLAPSVAILKRYYGCVKGLQNYLADILELNGRRLDPKELLSDDDSQSYLQLLSTSYVGVKNLTSGKTFRVFIPMLGMREVLDYAQERLFREKRAKNIITSGYRLASHANDNGKKGMARMGITNYFLNTVITALQAEEWENLLSRIGEDAMLHLLTETSIYVSLPNGCLCQLTGEPLINTAPPAYNDESLPKKMTQKRLHENATDTHNERPAKRLKLESSVALPNSTKPSGKRPISIPNSRRILVGLPLKHVLNRISPCYIVKPPNLAGQPSVDDSRQNAENARRLSKYVFARQYGLSNPFKTSGGSSPFYGDYLDRELEIKSKGSCKTPQRLKGILPVLEKLIRRHSRCGYIPLRDLTCPSKIKTTGSKDFDSSVILEMMSENSIQLKSQLVTGQGNISYDSSGNPIPAFGLTQAQKHAKQKPRFVEFACSHLEKFSITACDWLAPSSPGFLQQGRVSVSDAVKRRQLLEDFLFWYFDSFVLLLLKTNFYVTDSSAFRNNVLYFRHDDWATLCAPLVERLTSVTFEKLTDEEAAAILRQRKLGFSFVRLLPKETGVRPIVNLRRRKASAKGSYGNEQSINQILQGAFSILTYERSNQPENLGASIFNYNDICLKLKKLKASLPRDSKGGLPKLYFVKLDVQACFDTIDQTKLLHVIRQLISEDVYMIQKYGQVRSLAGKIRRMFLKKAVPEDDHPHFMRYAADLAGSLRDVIFVDQKQEVLQLLEEHITENIVKIGSTYYRQMVGIPQGSILSTILCSFFYGDLEKRFGKYTEDPHSALLRLTDDYLFVTTNLESAKGFLNMMKKGHPEYGCFIAQDKTLTNFEHGDHTLNVLDLTQKWWTTVDTTEASMILSVITSRNRKHANRRQRPTPWRIFHLQDAAPERYRPVKRKSHAIFSDRELNSKHIVYLNIYQNLLLTALKMDAYISALGEGGKKNTAFLRSVIQKTIVYKYTSVRMHARSEGNQNDGTNSDIHKEAVMWLGNHAFQYILSRKPQKYKALVWWLKVEMGRMKRKSYCYQFKELVTEGQKDFAVIAV